VPVVLDFGFTNDRPLCKWSYVIDLDNSVLKVYRGAKLKEHTASKRFTCIKEANDTVPALVKSFPFTKLPETQHDFINVLREAAVYIKQDLVKQDDIKNSIKDDNINDIKEDDIEENNDIKQGDIKDWIMPTLSF
jgi:hypothetical protein